MSVDPKRVSPVPLLTAEEIEMDPAYPGGGPPPLGFENVDNPQGGYPPQPGYPAVGE